jgi:hypothetical protein
VIVGNIIERSNGVRENGLSIRALGIVRSIEVLMVRFDDG